jgi:xanthine/uracil/vitamin C permease (AzgA family)
MENEVNANSRLITQKMKAHILRSSCPALVTFALLPIACAIVSGSKFGRVAFRSW